MKTIITNICSVFLATLVLAGGNVLAEEQGGMHHSPMAMELMGKKGADFEAAYIGMMILHHQSGMPMWDLAREKSTNLEIKALEKKTTPKEKAEVIKLTEWLKKLHSKSPADYAEPEESKKMMVRDMAELKAVSGKAFDELFAKKMAQHHMAAIEMSKLAESKAENPDVKKFAKEVDEAQSKDRETLLGIAKAKKD